MQIKREILRYSQYPRRYSEYKLFPESVKPRLCSILLTEKCMQRCKTCNFWRRPKPEMTTKQITSLITDLNKFGVEMITFSGGEPLLRDDLFLLSKKVIEHGMKPAVISNGYLINNTLAKKMSLTFRFIAISIDGATKETHDHIRDTSDSFNRAVDAVKALREHGANVRINFTIQPDNYKEMAAAVGLAESLDAKIFFQFAETSGLGNYPGANLQSFDLDCLKRQVSRLCGSKSVVTSLEYFKLALNRLSGHPQPFKCFAPHQSMLIGCDGTYYPCAAWDVPIGNVKEHSIKNIYYSRDFITLRKTIREGKMKKCLTCIQACEVETSLDMSLRHNISEWRKILDSK